METIRAFLLPHNRTCCKNPQDVYKVGCCIYILSFAAAWRLAQTWSQLPISKAAYFRYSLSYTHLLVLEPNEQLAEMSLLVTYNNDVYVLKKNLELILKVFTQVCFEEENTKFTPVAYLVAAK